MTLSQLFTKLKNILTAPLPVAGLEISATSIKFLMVKNQTILQASLRLPAGIIVHGEIKDRKSLVSALKSLHTQISPPSKPITVILNLPSSLPFTQAFSVPLIEPEHLEESIKLNLQMISPNKIEESYYDWQEIKTNKDLGHIELLGAFANSKAIDSFTSCAGEANFNIIAVEFPGIALARLIRERWGGLENEQSYLMIYINGEGLLLAILKNGNVYFNHFTSWEQVVGTGNELKTFEQIQDFFAQEIQRVLNFYLGRSGTPLTEAILISPVFNYEVVKLISQKLNLHIRNLMITELPKLQPNWFPVLGTGLRGVIPRSRDTEITLTMTNAQTGYYDERTIMFISGWRNIIIGAMVCMLASFIVIDTLLTKESNLLENQVLTEFSSKDFSESKKISGAITDFNYQLDIIEKIASQESSSSPFLKSVFDVAGKNIIIEKLSGTSAKYTLIGRGPSTETFLDFKNRLLKDSRFTGIDWSPASVTPDSDNKTVKFTIYFALASAEPQEKPSVKQP